MLLQLRDKGVLDLDDKLSKWFPEYLKADRITLTMLINGISGYPDYVRDDALIPLLYGNPFRQWQPDELIARVGAQPPDAMRSRHMLVLRPYQFCHPRQGAGESGRPLEHLIRDGILDPLSLNGTRSETMPAIQEPVLHSFTAERGKYEESTYWNPSWTLVRGAIMTSNVADILKSAAAIGTGALLSPESHACSLRR